MFSFNNEFIIQLILAGVSLLGLIPYFLAYKIGSGRKKTDSFQLPLTLYYISSYPSFVWYIMPLLGQPRLSGVLNIQGQSLAFIIPYILVCGLAFIYFSMMWSGKTIKMNLTATKDTFYAPKKLLTTGIYGKVQHPMISGDMIAHFSFILLFGAFNTLVLYPLYIFYSWAIVEIQVKYSLEPYFKQELIEYRKKTPAYLDKQLGMVVVLLIVLMIINLYLQINKF